MSKRKPLSGGANDLQNYSVPPETTESQSSTKEDNNSQNNTEKKKDKQKISFRMKDNEYEYFTKAAKLNNSTISGEIHRALAEYTRKHPL
jgi:hypothetical protein